MADNLDFVVNAFTQGIVTPLNNFGLGGFVFDIEAETTVNLSTEITDHYLEDNTAVQDHIAVRPKKVTLKSYVGELVFRRDTSTDTPVQKVVQKLTTFSAFLPTLTQGARQTIDFIRDTQLSDISLQSVTLESINKTINYWGLVKNQAVPVSRQQQAYQYFKTLMEQKVLMSVQTPFEFMTNMAIETITGVQEEDTKFMSSFSITLKQIRTASIQNGVRDAQKYAISEGTPEEVFQGRASQQRAPEVNIGNVDGVLPPGYNLDDLMTDDMYKAGRKDPPPPPGGP